MARQTEIPGTEIPHIEELEQAAEAYVKVRDKRMDLTEQEITQKTNLIQVALAHEKELSKDADGNRCYRFDDLLVILKPGKPTCKVKHDTGDDDEGDED